MKKGAESLKNKGYIKIISIEANAHQLKQYNSMIKGKWTKPLGKGEAVALSLAIKQWDNSIK